MFHRHRVYELIEKTDYPRTRQSLAVELRTLGLEAGDGVIVHSSLHSLGWVNGGSVTVVQALCDVVTETGTIVMPTHSDDYSDPANWRDPRIPECWIRGMRELLPAFDPEIVPTTGMGRIVEVFRTWPGTKRSTHPVTSFAAWGRHSEYVTADHTYEYGQGEGSPLARLYDIDGKVLLLGVGYDRNTSFHLAEYRISNTPKKRVLLPVPENGRSVWRPFDAIKNMTDEWLLELGDELEATGAVTVGNVGSAVARLFPQRAAVDFAIDWLKNKYDIF